MILHVFVWFLQFDIGVLYVYCSEMAHEAALLYTRVLLNVTLA